MHLHICMCIHVYINMTFHRSVRPERRWSPHGQSLPHLDQAAETTLPRRLATPKTVYAIAS